MAAALALAALMAVAPAQAAPPVQGLLQSGVTITCKLEESIAFYRDVLGQRVLDDSLRDAGRVALYVDIAPAGQVRLVSMTGTGTYPGGDATGGKLTFLGVTDAEACRNQPAGVRRARPGDVMFSLRVANLDEIAARVARAGAPVLVPPGISGSGKARNMMLIDPNGRIVEAFEVIAAPH